MSNIIRKLSRTSSSKSLRFNDSSTSTSNSSAYNLKSSSYEINKFTNSLPTSSATSSYSHHIKFNNSKLDEESNQIENQLKNISNFVSEIPLFEEEFESNIFSNHDKPSLNINIIRRRGIKRNHFIPDVELIKTNYFSPQNTTKRNYFQQLPPQVRNTLRKQYEKYMQ